MQVAVLSRDLQEKEILRSTGSRSSAETEEMLATMDSLTAERDQLKIDLHENIEMVGEPTLPTPNPTSPSCLFAPLMFYLYGSLHFIT